MNYNFHKAIIFLLFSSISFTVQNMQEHGFALTLILPYQDRIKILSLYGRIQVSEKPYSRIFYAVITTLRNTRTREEKLIHLRVNL